MPHKTGTTKQKNKPFKGSSKHKAESKNFGVANPSKKISKLDKPMTKDAKVNKLRQLRDNKVKSNKKDFDVVNDSMLKDAFIDLKNKMPGAPRIVLLAGFNEAAKPELIKESLAQLLVGSQEEIISINTKSATLEGNVPHEFQYVRITTNNKISPELKTENYIFLTCPRVPETFLDYCKIADIVGVVLSCKDADQSSVLLDPFAHAKAFDEMGYAMLTVMRAQGFPTVVGILQDLETINASKQASVKKIFQRFFESELGVDEKVVATNNTDPKSYMALMRVLQEVSLKQLEWREIRSYLLAEKLQVNPQNQLLEIEGFIKGNYFNPNQLVHITGYGDYPVLQVDILHNPFMPNHKKQKLVEDITSYGFTPDANALASFFAEEGKMDDYNQFPNENTQGIKRIKEKGGDDGFGLATEEEVKEGAMNNGFEEEVMGGTKAVGDRMYDEIEGEMEIQDENSDVSFDENNTDLLGSAIQEEKKQLRQLAKRDDDDKEFLDEIDYSTEVRVSERFKKYKAMKSFKTTEWNPYNDLPVEYEKIFIFDDFNKSKKLAIEKTQKEAVVYNGFYVKIYVAGFPLDSLANHDNNKPIVVSSLLSHERKISLLNLKVKRYLESSDVINSKETMEIHLGFRVFNTQPIFSKFINGSTKTKYEKKAHKDQAYMASFYGEVTYPPANAIIFRTNENGVKELAASGELMKPDPLRVIIKRAILTGYPLKIHKRLAVIKMMFFNPEDVYYYKNVELVTKNGLRGFIKESLGTHGYMKCVFNSPIKHNDTVCLNLYKRVFPKWPFEPVQQSIAATEDLLSLH